MTNFHLIDNKHSTLFLLLLLKRYLLLVSTVDCGGGVCECASGLLARVHLASAG